MPFSLISSSQLQFRNFSRTLVDSWSSFQNWGPWTLNKNYVATLSAESCPSTAPTPRSRWDLRYLPPSGGPLAKCSQLVASGLGHTRLTFFSHTWSVEEWGPGKPTRVWSHHSTSPGKSTPTILKINYLAPCSLQTFTIQDKDKNSIFPVGMEAIVFLLLLLPGPWGTSETGS